MPDQIMRDNSLKYIIYTRKSQENRDRQALSLESQVRELTEYAHKEHLTVVKILEESQTAYKPGRPIFAEMLEMFEMGLAHAALVWKPDRIARNAQDGGLFIQAMDDGKIKELRTPYERFRQEDNRMMLYIHFGMSNDYSRQISANVKRGNRQKYERGEFLGRAPVGFLNAKVGNSRNIVPDPEKAPLVQKLFQEYATAKYSVMDIVRMASDLKLASVSGKPIAKSGVYTLLRRPVYYGIYQHAGEFHQGSFQSLISKQLYDKVQLILKEHTKPQQPQFEHDFKRLVKCVSCGCLVTAETKRKFYKRTNRHAHYTYYHCSRRRGICKQKAVTDKELNTMFFEMLKNISLDQEAWNLGLKLVRSKYEAELTQIESMRQNWQRQYNQLQQKLTRLLDLRISNELTLDEYAASKKDLLDLRTQLKEKLDDEHVGSLQWLHDAEDFFETCYQAREVMESEDIAAKQALIRKVGSNLFLRDEKLEFSFKEPYVALLKPSSRSNMQETVPKRSLFFEL